MTRVKTQYRINKKQKYIIYMMQIYKYKYRKINTLLIKAVYLLQ